MQRPLQIAFKGLETSAALEGLIRERVGRLERLYPRLIGCRVVVEVPHRGAGSAKVPIQVSVEAEVPGRGPIIGKDSENRHEAKEDHTAALNNAFEAVERQLDKLSGTRDQEAAPAASDGMAGMVVRIFPDQGYGFIQSDNAPELYFTRNAVAGDVFDQMKVGMMVQVTMATDEGPMGPQASSVRLIDRNRAPA